MRAPLDVCEARDPKGTMPRARKGEMANFTGISAPYEEPEQRKLVLDTTADLSLCIHALEDYLTGAGVLAPPDADAASDRHLRRGLRLRRQQGIDEARKATVEIGAAQRVRARCRGPPAG